MTQFNGLVLKAQATYITRPIVYDGPRVMGAMANIVNEFLPALPVRIMGTEVEGDFEVDIGCSVFDAVCGVGEAMQIVTEWYTDELVIRPLGEHAGLALRS